MSLSVTRDASTWYPTGPQRWQASGCRATEAANRVSGGNLLILSPTQCQSLQGAGRLFVAGDLHAEAYEHMLSQLSQRDGIEVWIYNKAGCSYFNLRWPNADTSPDCARFALELKMKFLEALTEGDVLFCRRFDCNVLAISGDRSATTWFNEPILVQPSLRQKPGNWRGDNILASVGGEGRQNNF